MAASKELLFACRDVHVFVDDIEIVKGVDLEIRGGEKHALMGPNGSGKSSFAAALMGHPAYRLEGEVLVGGTSITELPPEERARLGMFLGFQHPLPVPGVSVGTFLRAATGALFGERQAKDFRRDLYEACDRLGVPREFAGRYLNDGFSGGEKKRLEVLQLLLLRPRFVLLDEIDSGLDIDALKVVADGINLAVGSDVGLLLVTHYQRILEYVRPDAVHVFVGGRIVRSGGPEEALLLEAKGYADLERAQSLSRGG